ncbi:10026_t:CDS:2 [Diversispora eburnea]|uniref:10026_t:CDS:1 n=1 Tax=Diversispora eburnea TaxID=1213867 RepID=A0A9N9F041_9GLOM|nr:10026_t:CDS:2 [Diversispora eburnea]
MDDLKSNNNFSDPLHEYKYNQSKKNSSKTSTSQLVGKSTTPNSNLDNSSASVSPLTSFINTPKYIKQYFENFGDSFKSDKFEDNTSSSSTSVTYSLNMQISHKFSNSSFISTYSDDDSSKELKFKKRRSTITPADAINPKKNGENYDTRNKSQEKNETQLSLVDDSKCRCKPGKGSEKSTQKEENFTTEHVILKDKDVDNSFSNPNNNSKETEFPIPSFISKVNENNNNEHIRNRSSSTETDNCHKEYLINDIEIIDEGNATVSNHPKSKSKGNNSSDYLNIGMNDGTISSGYAKANPKRNRDYHSFFKSIPQNEYLLNDYGCALQKEILIQGRIYVSLNHICFHANIFGWTTNLKVPFTEVVNIEKKMTAFLIPNAILITTLKSKHFFASFLSRDTAYETFIKIWHYANPMAASKQSELQEYISETNHQKESTCESANSISDSDNESSKTRSQPRAKPFQLLRKNLVLRKQTRDEAIKIETNNLPSPKKSLIMFCKEPGPKLDDFDTPTTLSNDINENSHQEPNFITSSNDVNENSQQEQNSTISSSSLRPSSQIQTLQQITLNDESQKQLGLETQCDCLKMNQHYNDVIMDTKFTGTIEKIYNLLFTSGFIPEFITKLENNNDTEFGEWDTTEDGKLIRKASYTKRLKNVIGPKSTKCYLTDECLNRDFNNYVTTLSTTQTPYVPSGKTFSVKTRTCIMWAGKNKVRVIVTASVEFSKANWLKGTIEKGVIDGQIEHFKALEIAVRKYIAQNRSEFREPEFEIDNESDVDSVPLSPTKKKKSVSSTSYISTTLNRRPSSRRLSQSSAHFGVRNISQSNFPTETINEEENNFIQSIIKSIFSITLTSISTVKSLLEPIQFTIPNLETIVLLTLIIITLISNGYIWIYLRDLNNKVDKYVGITTCNNDDYNNRLDAIANLYGMRGRYGMYQDKRIFDIESDKFLEWMLEKSK